jgi:fatty-acid desaturase
MSLNTKVRLLQLVNYILAFFAVGYVSMTSEYNLLIYSMISWFIIGHISTIITLHRLLTHRSFSTYKWLENILSLISVISTVGPTISWVALHRMHHQHSDTNFDPHTQYKDDHYSVIHSIKVFIGYDWVISNIPVKYVKDLMRDPVHKFIFNHYFKIIFSFIAMLFIIDPVLVLFVYALPATLTVITIGIVNTLGHGHGYRNHETKDKSTNSWIANLISLGEGLHNNHHAKPSKWYIGEKWYELDIMGCIIMFIKKYK